MTKIRVALILLIMMLARTGVEALSLPEETDAAWKNRHAYENSRQGMELFKKVIDAAPDNYVALWKYGRSCCFYVNYFCKNNAEKITILEDADKMLLKAISLNDQGVEAVYWEGVAFGSLAGLKGMFAGLASIGPLISKMEKVNSLDEKIENGGAYRMLGCTYLEVPGWPLSVGDKAKALNYLEKALAISPDDKENNYHYARTLMSLNRKEEALKIIDRILALPIKEDYITEETYIINEFKKIK